MIDAIAPQDAFAVVEFCRAAIERSDEAGIQYKRYNSDLINVSEN